MQRELTAANQAVQSALAAIDLDAPDALQGDRLETQVASLLQACGQHVAVMRELK